MCNISTINCFEKNFRGEKIEDETPLVIPMKPNTLITAERLKEIAEKVENFDEKETKDDKSENKDVPNNETLDQMAVRELLEDAKKEKVVETPTLVVPINAKPVFEGQKEVQKLFLFKNIYNFFSEFFTCPSVNKIILYDY